MCAASLWRNSLHLLAEIPCHRSHHNGANDFPAPDARLAILRSMARLSHKQWGITNWAMYQTTDVHIRTGVVNVSRSDM